MIIVVDMERVSQVHLEPIRQGIYMTWKPTSVSSFGWISRVRRECGFKKIGHAGTLDPFAEGILVVATDKHTKEIGEFVGLPKEYIATIVLGQGTDTLDNTGTITNEVSISPDTATILMQSIVSDFSSLVGTHTIPVPCYSAKSIGGRRLHRIARNGQEVPVIMHDAVITSAQLNSLTYTNDTLAILCVLSVTSGTYVRSIAHMIGERYGLPAHVSSLIRSRVGEFTMKNPYEEPVIDRI